MSHSILDKSELRPDQPSLGLATITLGGETCGSIIDPASYNNVVGMKPST